MSKKRVEFIFCCAIATGLAMLVSMLVGERMFSEDLFGGFSKKPMLWLMVLIESAVWILPITLIGQYILEKYKKLEAKKFAALSAGLWLLLGLSLVICYNGLHFSNQNWTTQGRLPEIAFGWLVPCVVIWAALTFFSMPIRSETQQGPEN